MSETSTMAPRGNVKLSKFLEGYGIILVVVAMMLVLAAIKRRLSFAMLRDVTIGTATMTAMIFVILFGAAVFSIVFRVMGGDNLVHEFLANMPGGAVGAVIVVMLIMFVLGFILDTFEIIFIVIPITAPILLKLGVDPIWLGVIVGMNLQTSFLTPPFGFSLFYLRGVAPPQATGSGTLGCGAGWASAGTTWVASQPLTADTSAWFSCSATWAMQSGAWARRWPVRQAPSWLLR